MKSLKLSILLHVLPLMITVLLGLVGISSCSYSNNQHKGSQANNQNNKSLPGNTPQTIEIEVIPKINQPNGDNSNNCKKWYGGIGINIDLSKGRIIDVYEGYPAELAGLKAGDELDNISANTEIRGEPGTDVTLVFLRPTGNEEYTRSVYNIKRAKICIDEK